MLASAPDGVGRAQARPQNAAKKPVPIISRSAAESFASGADQRSRRSRRPSPAPAPRRPPANQPAIAPPADERQDAIAGRAPRGRTGSRSSAAKLRRREPRSALEDVPEPPRGRRRRGPSATGGRRRRATRSIADQRGKRRRPARRATQQRPPPRQRRAPRSPPRRGAGGERDRGADVGAEAPGGEDEHRRRPRPRNATAIATARVGSAGRAPRRAAPCRASAATRSSPPARCRSRRSGRRAPGSGRAARAM